MWSFIFFGLWVTLVGVVLLAMWRDWATHARVRAGLIGASLGVLGAGLWQSPTVLDALFALGLFTGLSLILVGDGRLLAIPDVAPASPTDWTDEAIGVLAGDRSRLDEWTVRLGTVCCAGALLVAGFQVWSLPPRSVAAGPTPELSLPTATPYRRVPQAPTPSHTPTRTATPTTTPSPTPTATLDPALLSSWINNPKAIWVPPGPTPLPPLPAQDLSELRFVMQAPLYFPNATNTLGCRWSGVGGQVFDRAGEPLPSYVVRLWTAAAPQNAQAGDFPAYGPAGFEFTLGDHPRDTTGFYVIELLDSAGHSVSRRYGLDTDSACDRNFVLVIFVEE